MADNTSFRFVKYLWDDQKARTLDPVSRLVYRSNLLGEDQRITNTGGGNTSSKITETDPLTGGPVEVLWVKGSGGDLRTADKAFFSSLYQSKVIGLKELYDRTNERGPKTPVEDRMVGMYPHCTFNLNPRATSIDTPLHAFIPHRHVDHTHPNAVISVAASKNGEELTRQIYGDDVVWIPWQRPGFDLGLQLAEACRKHPRARGAILGQHGLINWADDDKQCYELSLELIEKAAAFIEKKDRGDATFGGRVHASLAPEERRRVLVQVLPWLRGKLTTGGSGSWPRQIATVQDDETILRFVNSKDAPRLAELGTSCPDHFLRTKIKPLLVDWKPDAGDVAGLKKALEAGIEKYRGDYLAYHERCKHADSPAVRNPNPSVVLVPGVGMIAWGKNKSESRVTAEFYNCAVEVMRGAEAIGQYVALPQQEAFDIEYWLLEEAKLRRMPPERELAGRVIVIVGAGNGIGRTAATRVSTEGAHVACVDLDAAAAEATAQQVIAKQGAGIGVAGSGISGCGPAAAIGADLTRRESIREAIAQTVLAYGGIDDVVVTAGVFIAPDSTGRVSDEQWSKTFAVNVQGAAIAADEATGVWRDQGLSGSLVITTSVNAVVAKKGSVAYDTSKAAANHLVRELAIELAPLVRVNGVAPATVIEGSTMFPRDRVIASLSKYNIAFSPDEPTPALIDKLGAFYAGRTLLKKAITPADQAEAIFLLVSQRLGKTTGQVISVDAGLADAFLR
ncbi:MAG: 3-phenylpropionate-dihydrodiol/cinnamic acid-dihydrodiol dehydrogenase [Phycisphaerales bacterium]|nr:3-phenylpropionate-dihydrodiol/cinnamic acid-dihydrodiol dehydrogenase [Phycisphaerales bacterium]